MGNCCPVVRFRRRQSHVNPKNVTLLLAGLDNAGKTTIAKRLSEEPLDAVLPTVGFSKVTLQEKGCSITIYDLGGGPQIRNIWPRYYPDVHGVIFVIDASDIARMNECRKALEAILLDDYITGKPILLLANKQDVDGALDEIDIVDRLNVERLVNQQRCPTLVELCSARHFSRKMDIGIDNGYKWLLRCISKDYPSLNNRVLKDLATQEEMENAQRIQKVERIRRRRQQEMEIVDVHQQKESVTILKGDKPHQNGIIKMVDTAGIPGQIHEPSVPRNEIPGSSRTFSWEFFKSEMDNSDIELINRIDAGNTRRNFLVRPKSSGGRINTNKTVSGKNKHPRRKSYHKNNKTAPNPMVELSAEPMVTVPRIFNPGYKTEVKSFTDDVENEENLPPNQDSPPPKPRIASAKLQQVPTFQGGFTPNSGKNKSLQISDNLSKLGTLPPLKMTNSPDTELILDVNKLD